MRFRIASLSHISYTSMILKLVCSNFRGIVVKHKNNKNFIASFIYPLIPSVAFVIFCFLYSQTPKFASLSFKLLPNFTGNNHLERDDIYVVTFHTSLQPGIKIVKCKFNALMKQKINDKIKMSS